MGQNESSFKKTYEETVSELSNVQLAEISARFRDLYAKAGGSKGLVVDREAFSRYLDVPVTVGDRLFDAFDRKKVMFLSRVSYYLSAKNWSCEPDVRFPNSSNISKSLHGKVIEQPTTKWWII